MPGICGNVLIGGGTGFVGSHLTKLLTHHGYAVKIISRMPGPQRMSWQDLSKNGIPEGTTAVVNLAGQNVLDFKQRWNAGFKQNIWNSRINTTQSLAKAIEESEDQPSSFIVMTGVGIYQPSQDVEYTEEHSGHEFDFLSKLCHHWEKAAELGTQTNCRQVIIRSGVVLGRDGGMIKQLYLPYLLGVGGPVGSGQQYLPWIHVDDITRMILFGIENNNVRGVMNGVAPQQITNKEFSKAFASALWRPSLFQVPEIVLNTLLSEERAKILTTGQRVLPDKPKYYGFEYKFPDINSACKQITLK